MFRPDAAAADGEEYRNFQSNLGSQDVYFDILIVFSKIGQINWLLRFQGPKPIFLSKPGMVFQLRECLR